MFESKISVDLVVRGIETVTARHPGAAIVVLLDESFDMPAPVTAIDCRTLPLAAFLEGDFTRTVYLYACTADDVGAPFVEAIIARGGLFVPVHEAIPSSY